MDVRNEIVEGNSKRFSLIRFRYFQVGALEGVVAVVDEHRNVSGAEKIMEKPFRMEIVIGNFFQTDT